MLRHAFGDALDEVALTALCEAAEEAYFAAGDVFVRQGEIGETFYVITDGRVEVSQSLDDGQEIILDIIKPGQYVGELALIDQAPRMATCRALTPVSALRFDKPVFNRMLHENPAVAGLVLQHVIRNMRGQDQLIIQELRQTNEELRRAYADLQAAQEELLEKERLEHELALAAEAQQSLLPGELPDLPPYRFAAYQRPALGDGQPVEVDGSQQAHGMSCSIGRTRIPLPPASSRRGSRLHTSSAATTEWIATHPSSARGTTVGASSPGMSAAMASTEARGALSNT